jgi:hypothetical protein
MSVMAGLRGFSLARQLNLGMVKEAVTRRQRYSSLSEIKSQDIASAVEEWEI